MRYELPQTLKDLKASLPNLARHFANNKEGDALYCSIEETLIYAEQAHKYIAKIGEKALEISRACDELDEDKPEELT